MEIQHRISLNSKKDKIFYKHIIDAGVKHKIKESPGGKSYFVWFDITESDPNWSELSRLIRISNVVDIYDTFFNEKEIFNAEWVRLISSYTEGYPQPFDTWVTNPTNYKNKCRECGTFQQESSFFIKKEPFLRGNDFMTMNWAVTAFFCTPRVFQEFEAHQIKGYENWKVIISKTKLPSNTISQLFIPHETKSGLLDGNELEPIRCQKCFITRYSHHQRGVMHYERNAFDPDLDIVRSIEWFGAGREAYQEVLVSKRIVKLIVENGWKGVRFKVVKLI
jgi:hypothetical protein